MNYQAATVRHEIFNSAEEFLRVLSPGNARWGGGLSIEWIFRGHGDSSWRLVPSAWRAPIPEPIASTKERARKLIEESGWSYLSMEGIRNSLPPTLRDAVADNDREVVLSVLSHRIAEYEVAAAFYDLADELGFRVRKPTPHPLDLATRKPVTTMDDWTNDSDFALLALAQHSGVPTRLLDWTRNPFAAAYFACEAFLRDTESSADAISVWALHSHPLHRLQRYTKVRFVVEAKADNPYLAAQDGVLTLFMESNDYFTKNFQWPSLDLILQLPVDVPKCEGLFRLDLVASEAKSLMKLLWRQRITRAHLRPSLDHVAGAIRERMWIET